MGRLSGSIKARARWRADQSCRGRFGRVRDCDARLRVGFGLMVALEAGETGVQPGDCGNHRGNSHEVDGASQVVRQGGEAELPADVLESARQERTLAHPLLDRTERVFDGLPGGGSSPRVGQRGGPPSALLWLRSHSG